MTISDEIEEIAEAQTDTLASKIDTVQKLHILLEKVRSSQLTEKVCYLSQVTNELNKVAEELVRITKKLYEAAQESARSLLIFDNVKAGR